MLTSASQHWETSCPPDTSARQDKKIISVPANKAEDSSRYLLLPASSCPASHIPECLILPTRRPTQAGHTHHSLLWQPGPQDFKGDGARLGCSHISQLQPGLHTRPPPVAHTEGGQSNMAPAHCRCLWHVAESCTLVGMMEDARCGSRPSNSGCPAQPSPELRHCHHIWWVLFPMPLSWSGIGQSAFLSESDPYPKDTTAPEVLGLQPIRPR